MLAGCSRRPEQPILQQFFTASSAGNRAALGPLATVTFDPQTDGVVTTFTITNVTAEEHIGGRVTKNVAATASVKMPNGQTVEKKLAIAMERQSDRWIITGIISR